MTKIEVNKETMEQKIKFIEAHLKRLQELKKLSSKRFALPDNFDIAAWNLRCALESTFDICAHILSRISGVKATEYKEMALAMGKQNILPMNFAENQLYKMAGYRNRLTHFYFEVGGEEMQQIIQNNLGDFEIFMKHIKPFIL